MIYANANKRTWPETSRRKYVFTIFVRRTVSLKVTVLNKYVVNVVVVVVVLKENCL